MKFAVAGVAGFVAPRHCRAIADVGGQLVAALDPHDSVGLLDSYNRNAAFFTEPERFDRFLWKHRGSIDIVSICSPNHLHDAHCRMALRSGANAICEKPLALRPWNVAQLMELERETGRAISVVMQMRLHPVFVGLRQQVADKRDNRAVIRYVTPRGRWYDASWKGDASKSGGVCMNVGIHLFDVLGWLFGDPVAIDVHDLSSRRGSGHIQLERAHVDWLLSTDAADLPRERSGPSRIFEINGTSLDASSGFENLHTELYRAVMRGDAPRAEDAMRGISIVHQVNERGGGL